MLEKTISVSEASEIIGVSEKTIRNYCKEGKIAYYRFGGSYKIIESSFKDFIESQKVDPAQNNKGEKENE